MSMTTINILIFRLAHNLVVQHGKQVKNLLLITRFEIKAASMFLTNSYRNNIDNIHPQILADSPTPLP